MVGCSQSNSDSKHQSAANAIELASRAESLFKRSKLSEGLDTLSLAVASNPDDAGRNLDLAASDSLDEAKLQHAEQQLKRMLVDRPQMALCLKPGDDLWNWVVRKFAGEDSGLLAIWDAKDPTPFESDFVAQPNEVFIQVQDRENCSSDFECDAQWAGVIFELYHSAAVAERANLRRQIEAGQIGAQEYARERMAIAERAKQQTRAFFLRFFAPMRLAGGAKKLWPNEWHGYGFFSDKNHRERSWQRDVRWSQYMSAYKIYWVDSPAAQANPELAERYLQDVKSREDSLGVGLRTVLCCYLANFHLDRGELGAAQDALQVANKLWPDLRSVQEWSQYVSEIEPASEVSEKRTLPESPVSLAEAARLKFRSGDVNAAAGYIFKAIELDPRDAGSVWNEHRDAKISSARMEQGEKQLKAMLKDRPTMAEYSSPGDELWNWAARRFAGEGTGHQIEWNPADPGQADARCWRSQDGRTAAIQVRDLEESQALTPVEKFNRYWALVVFELYNLSHGAGKNLDTLSEAREGKLTREEFIVAELDQEMVAVQCSRMFYLKMFMPYMQAKGMSTDPHWWYCFTFYLDDAARLKHYQSLPHWAFYSSFYDQLRLLDENPEVRRAYDLHRAGKLDEAMAVVDGVLEANPTSAGALYMRGNLLLQAGNAEDALRVFSKGLQVDAMHTGLLYGRGQANLRLRRFEDASRDFTALVHAAPTQPTGYYGRARVVLANPQPESSQRRAAVDDAKRACELNHWKTPTYLKLLLKAYSAVDDADGIRSVERKLEELKSSPRDQSGDSPTTSLRKYRARSVVSSAPTYAMLVA